MKSRYPVEAFVLAFLLFSGTMKEALVSGILLTEIFLLCALLYRFLEEKLPMWSQKACILIMGSVFYACMIQISFWYLDIALTGSQWLLAAVIGGYASFASGQVEGKYSVALYQSCLAWGILLFSGILREYLTTGMVNGAALVAVPAVTKAFGNIMFGFLTGAIGIAALNGIFKTEANHNCLLPGLAILVFCYPPIVMPGAVWLPGTAGVLLTALLLYSVRRRLRFSNAGKSWKGIPVELLSVGFWYMILKGFQL